MANDNVTLLSQTTRYPAEWDDLVDETGKVHATIYTLEHLRSTDDDTDDGLLAKLKNAPGFLRVDGIYEIVVDSPEITRGVVRQALDQLSKTETGKYGFVNNGNVGYVNAEELQRPRLE